MTFKPGDPVFAKQELDALGHLANDRVLASLHLGQIERHTGNLNAVIGQMLAGVFKLF